MIRKFYVLLFLLLLLIPLLQKLIGIKNCDYKLSGYSEAIPKPYFKWHDFFAATYQEHADTYLQQNVAFKGFFITLKNQIDYSLFNTLHYSIKKGEDDELFLQNHIDAHCGQLSISEDSLHRKLNECVELKTILDSMHIPMVFVLAPGKPGYYEDKLPVKYKNKCSKDNDYLHVLEGLTDKQLPVVDYNAWFRANRNNFKYPVFPKLGIHWSYYAACVVMDSLNRYIEKALQVNLLKPKLTGTIVTEQPYTTDKDLWSLLNLLLPMQSDSLAYPEYSFADTLAPHYKPRILIISDSYTWVMLDTKLPANTFSPASRFWFYKKELYDMNGMWVSNDPFTTNSYQSLNGTDMVIFLATETLYSRLDYGFANWLKTNKAGNSQPGN